ncbi:hypothetical protein A33M_2436 [Rhodovulum sp. PH10]|nr:hypothetical protein A33M_2436 [Rhodovulum sp. PH10]
MVETVRLGHGNVTPKQCRPRTLPPDGRPVCVRKQNALSTRSGRPRKTEHRFTGVAPQGKSDAGSRAAGWGQSPAP